MEGATGAYYEPDTVKVCPLGNYDPDAITGAMAILKAQAYDPTAKGASATDIFLPLETAEEGQGESAEAMGLAINLAVHEPDAQPFEPEEPEPEPVTEEARHVVFGTWVFSSHRGRTERARDSVGSHEDRQFDRGVAIAAARAHVQRLRKQGRPRPKRPAPDGYLPGRTPSKSDTWNRTVAEDVLCEEHGLSLTREVSLKSPAVQKVLADREAEPVLAASAGVRAKTSTAFEAHPIIPADEAARLAAAEIAEFNAQEDAELGVEKTPSSKEFPFCDPESAREYMVFAGLIKGAKAKLQQLGQPSPQPRLATDQPT